MALFHEFVLIAQAAQGQAAPAAPDDAPQDTNFLPRLLFIITAFGLMMYFFFLRPQKRKEEGFKQMISNLKENDHVVTVGGIYGVITNVQRDADRVTIRVDDGTNAKLRVSTSAIARVVSDDDSSSDGAASGNLKK